MRVLYLDITATGICSTYPLMTICCTIYFPLLILSTVVRDYKIKVTAQLWNNGSLAIIYQYHNTAIQNWYNNDLPLDFLCEDTDGNECSDLILQRMSASFSDVFFAGLSFIAMSFDTILGLTKCLRLCVYYVIAKPQMVFICVAPVTETIQNDCKNFLF